MSVTRPITIIGGGLGGLALGAALAREGAAVTVCEAGRLPRPRVCGEFLSGLRADVVARLGLARCLHGAAVNRTTGWHAGGRLRFAAALPEPALGLSRQVLEERLLANLVAHHGELQQNMRVQDPDSLENSAGHLWAAGRRPDPASPWLGLKIHCRNLRLGHDLELHLGHGGYAGAARIEDGRVNICALFRARPGLKASRENLLPAYLTACGLNKFAERVAAGDPDPTSVAAVSGLDFSRTWPDDHRLSLGDHQAAIPPYTGHGMAMALEGAAAALDPLLAYARQEMEWPETMRRIRVRIAAQQNPRILWARRLHPWLLHSTGQTALLTLARFRLLPFQYFYRATHGASVSPASIFPPENAAI